MRREASAYRMEDMLGEYGRRLGSIGVAVLCGLSSLLASENDQALQQAKAVLQASGVRGGLIVHLGCDQGRLTAALHANDRFVVQGLERDVKNVDAARQYIRSLGLYGQVSVRHWTGKRLPYGDNLVNLLVVSPQWSVDREEVQRVLRPGGVAVTLDSRRAPQQTFRKPVPDEIDDWTHYLHDSGNNAVAEDDRVGPPRYLQWKSGPMWCRSHEFASSVQALISANGRLIGVIDEGIIGQPRGVPALWTLIARDAFNGILLWRRPCDQINPHALVAVGERVYVTLQNRGPLSILDAATGQTLHTCQQTGKVNEIAFCENRLILSTRLTGNPGSSGPHVIAADPQDGHVIWQKAVETVAKNSLVAGAGRVCYCDSSELVCLSLENGEELWRTDVKRRPKGYVVLYQGTVFLTGGSTRAFSLETGKLLWTGPDGSPHARNPPGLFGARGLIWTAWDRVDPRSFLWQHREETRNGYDPRTGEVKKTVIAKRLVTAGHHIRCYPPKATRRYLLLNKRGVEFFDLQGTNHMRANWTRGACGFGMLPANGFLYTPPSQCFCYQGVLLTGLNALSATRESSASSSETESRGHVERGPAFGDLDTSRAARNASAAADWPTYRHDVLRSGSIDTSLPVELDRVWETPVCAPTSGSTDQPARAGERLKLRERPEEAAGSGLIVAVSQSSQ